MGCWPSDRAGKWQHRVSKPRSFGSNPVFCHLAGCPSERVAQPLASKKPYREGTSQMSQRLLRWEATSISIRLHRQPCGFSRSDCSVFRMLMCQSLLDTSQSEALP